MAGCPCLAAAGDCVKGVHVYMYYIYIYIYLFLFGLLIVLLLIGLHLYSYYGGAYKRYIYHDMAIVEIVYNYP